MSEISSIPPPPPTPPPPPPPAAARGTEFDFARAFTFAFEDPNWLQKILIGGLFVLAGFVVIGWFFILGYMARLARNVMNGTDLPLPEWDNLGDAFAEGFRLFVIGFVYYLPLVVLALLIGIPAAIAGAMQNESLEFLGSGFAGCMACLIVPVAFAITLWLPAALLRSVATGQMSSAFEVGAIWQFIRTNVLNYLLAIAVYIVARFLGGIGVILFCIGVIFTAFWALLVQTHGFAQAWRLRKNP